MPLLVPCFLARTRPLLCPRRSLRRKHKRAGRAKGLKRGRLYTAGLQLEESSQRHTILRRQPMVNTAI